MTSLLSGRGTGSSLKGILTPATESRKREKRSEESDRQF